MSSEPAIRRSKRLQKEGPELILPLESIAGVFKEPHQTKVIKTGKSVKSKESSSSSISSSSLVSKKTVPEEKGQSTAKSHLKQSKTTTHTSSPPSSSSSSSLSSQEERNAALKKTELSNSASTNKNATPVKAVQSRKVLKAVEMDQVKSPASTGTASKLDRQRTVLKRTPSMKDTFPGRLEWKQKHYGKPVTSTPVASSKTSSASSAAQKNNNNDAGSCFGFDDPDEEELDYSTLISPIPRERVHVQRQQGGNILFKRVPDPLPRTVAPVPPLSPQAKFNHLLHRYNDDEEDENDVLHVNRM